MLVTNRRGVRRTADLNLLICSWMRDLRLVEIFVFLCLEFPRVGGILAISYLISVICRGSSVTKIFIPNVLLLKQDLVA
jgi:hypothetical protein